MAEQSNIGLRPTRAVSTDFGAIAQQGAQNFIAQQERERLAEERERQRLQEFEDRYGIDESLYVMDDTEFRTVNDATTEALSTYRDRYYEVYKELQKNPNNLELKKKLGNISNSVERMRGTHEKFLKMGEDGIKMISEDRMSGVDEETWKEQLEAFDEGRIKVKLDEKDNMQYLFYNKQGKLSQVVPYTDFIKGSLIEKVDVQKEVSGMLKLIGRDKYDEVTGSFIKTVDNWGAGQEQQAKELIQKLIVSDDVKADLLNQATNGVSKKRTGFDSTDDQRIQDYLLNTVKNAYDEASSVRQRPRYGSGGSGSRKTASPLDNIQAAVDVDQGGGLMRNGNAVLTYKGGIQLDATKSDERYDNIMLTPSGGIKLTGQTRIKIKDYPEGTSPEQVASDSGTSIYNIEKGNRTIDGKVTYYRKKDISTDGEEDINKLANLLGLSDADGLREHLKSKLSDKFGQDNVEAFLRGEITQKNNQEPKETNVSEEPEVKEVKGSSGSSYK